MNAHNRMVLAFIFVCLIKPMTLESAEPKNRLTAYISEREAEFEKIPADRRKLRTKIVDYGRAQIDRKLPIKLTFICTHNSRRSQMTQVWATLAAVHYGIPKVEAFSGGTEETAFNPRAVAALERAGVKIKPDSTVKNSDNPRYEVVLGQNKDPLLCFSKVYDKPPNPDTDFAAVMTCSEADQNCPTVVGAKVRICLPYDDPKVSDGTAQETKAYDDRCEQIAREMLFMFSQFKSNP